MKNFCDLSSWIWDQLGLSTIFLWGDDKSLTVVKWFKSSYFWWGGNSIVRIIIFAPILSIIILILSQIKSNQQLELYCFKQVFSSPVWQKLWLLQHVASSVALSIDTYMTNWNLRARVWYTEQFTGQLFICQTIS
jgi:hypothetical protein